jgi:hypothetical protein
VFLAFATNYGQLPTLRAKALDIATEQVNEYKFGSAHSIAALELKLTGRRTYLCRVEVKTAWERDIPYMKARTIPSRMTTT